jgi:hypothetical protein
MPTNWLDELINLRTTHPTATNAVGGGLLGAALMGGQSALTRQGAGETREERRNRILRNAAAGGIMGTGAGAAVTQLPRLWSSLMPEPSTQERAAQGLATEFGHDKPLGGLTGRALSMLGLGGAMKAKDRWKAQDVIRGKAKDFVQRLSEAAATAQSSASEAWSKMQQDSVKAHSDHANNIHAEVRKRVADWGKAPEFAAQVDAALAGKVSDPGFQSQLAKRLAASPGVAPDVVEAALKAELKTSLMEEMTRAKGQDFHKIVQGELKAPPQLEPKDMETLLHKSRMQHLSPLARELQMDWGNTTMQRGLRPNAPMGSNVDDIVKQLDSLMARGKGGELYNSMHGGRFSRGGYTGAPTSKLAPGSWPLRLLLMGGGFFTPEIMRNIPGVAAKGTDVIERTLQP